MAEAAALHKLSRHNRWALLVAPLAILLVMAMIVVPLPPFMISALFALNIAAGLVILAASLYVRSPTDLTSFPSMLLITTLARLALNVATARVILLNGYQGEDAAGEVIASFGSFVVGGNYVVGFIIFMILIVINFVVVTKGADRVAEVGARFTLDSLPGKQMAIDADLNAGMLDPQEAENRRNAVRQEADFFGAMDGACKFVRGDVIAAMVILAINLIGGLAVGVLQHGLPISAAARTYTLLTIGDGVAAQIPSLTISIAAGLVVTRVATGQDVGAQIAAQIGRYPQALAAGAGLMLILGIVPGMPHWPFLLLAALIGFGSWMAFRSQSNSDVNGPENTAENGNDPRTPPQPDTAPNQNISGVDPLCLEIGYAIVPMVEHQGQTFLDRMRSVRERYGQRMGFTVPPISVRDSEELRPSEYRFTIRGASVGGSQIYLESWLAIQGPETTLTLDVGRKTTDPAYGQPAWWVDHDDVEKAEAYGYTVVDPQTVIATHLDQLLVQYGHELLGRRQAEILLAHLADHSPKLTEEIQSNLNVSLVKQVLQHFLAERIPIRDLEGICEALVDAAMGGERDPEALYQGARLALGRFIIEWVGHNAQTLDLAVLEPQIEQLVAQGVQTAREHGRPGMVEPSAAVELRAAAQQATERFNELKRRPVLAVQASIRLPVAQMVAPLPVIALEEIPPDKSVNILFSVPERSTGHDHV